MPEIAASVALEFPLPRVLESALAPSPNVTAELRKRGSSSSNT
ncbi:MAG: hypothetical protein ACRDNR_15645 [Gaiellaceae bacterium]